jgi:hypothetical protein
MGTGPLSGATVPAYPVGDTTAAGSTTSHIGGGHTIGGGDARFSSASSNKVKLKVKPKPRKHRRR